MSAIGEQVFVVVRHSSSGKIVDLGPEIFRDEGAAWAAADALNKARRRFKAHGCTSVEPATFEVIPRKLLGGQ